MKTFTYKITDEVGIHARPAGMLVKKAKGYNSEVTLECKGKSANATRLMSVMGMGVKCGDEVTVTVKGADEEEAVKGLESFFSSNL